MKKNLPLIIGIALPLVFVLIISLVIFLPSLSVKPQYNFIYTTNDYYSYNQAYKNTFAIENNHIVLQPVSIRAGETYVGTMPTLYLYDVKANNSHQISFDEAKNLTLDAGPSSPDGYTIKYQYNNEGIFELFGSNGNNDRGYFVTKNNGAKKLTGFPATDYYWSDGSLKFIGWIK